MNTADITARFAAAGLTLGPWSRAPISDGLALVEATLEQRAANGCRVVVQHEGDLGLSYFAQDDRGHVVRWGTLYPLARVDQLVEAITATMGISAARVDCLHNPHGCATV